jgi:uncharacterized protein
VSGAFVNRTHELDQLERWWDSPGQSAVVWGRRRVGKTALLQRFGSRKPAIFHTGADRGEDDELALLSQHVDAVLPGPIRDLRQRPYANWDDAFDDLAARAADRPALLVLDEFPELVSSSPRLPGTLRAFLDRSARTTQLRIVLCGSAVRHMQALQEEREPLYGRFDLSLLVHPFAPHEASLMLPDLTPEDRALVYGVVGGMPLYLSWWDQSVDIKTNLARLVCEPGARLLSEGDLVLRTDVEGGDYAQKALYAIATGRTQYGQIKDHIKAEPLRTLERLVDLRLIERLQPPGESERSKRRLYRIADPFIAFHLGVTAQFRTEIERGLGPSILPVLRQVLDEHMGAVFEEAFRQHLRTLASSGGLATEEPVVAIGPWWDHHGQNEIDALVLAGRSSRPVIAGEAKWTPKADGGRLVAALRKKVAEGLHADPDALDYAVCARSSVHHLPSGVRGFTAADLFSPSPEPRRRRH